MKLIKIKIKPDLLFDSNELNLIVPINSFMLYRIDEWINKIKKEKNYGSRRCNKR